MLAPLDPIGSQFRRGRYKDVVRLNVFRPRRVFDQLDLIGHGLPFFNPVVLRTKLLCAFRGIARRPVTIDGPAFRTMSEIRGPLSRGRGPGQVQGVAIVGSIEGEILQNFALIFFRFL